MITTDHRESKRAYEVLHAHTQFVSMPLSQEEEARREHERKRANWKWKVAQRNHYFKYTIEK